MRRANKKRPQLLLQLGDAPLSISKLHAAHLGSALPTLHGFCHATHALTSFLSFFFPLSMSDTAYPTITQCALVAAAFKILLFPA